MKPHFFQWAPHEPCERAASGSGLAPVPAWLGVLLPAVPRCCFPIFFLIFSAASLLLCFPQGVCSHQLLRCSPEHPAQLPTSPSQNCLFLPKHTQLCYLRALLPLQSDALKMAGYLPSAAKPSPADGPWRASSRRGGRSSPQQGGPPWLKVANARVG